MDEIISKRTTKDRKSFSMDNVILIFKTIKTDYGVSKGGTIPMLGFKVAMAETTNNLHPYHLDQFVDAIAQLRFISLNENKTEVKILRDFE